MFSFRAYASKSWGFIRFVVCRFQEGQCAEVAASLTFTTLLALVPLLTVTVTVFATFPVFSDLTTQLKNFILNNMVPEVAGKIITVHMAEFSANAAKLTLLGIAGLAVTTLLLMNTIGHTFNTIWRVRKPRPLLQRFLTYWTVLTIGPIILGASLSVTYYLVRLSLGYVQHVPLLGQLGLKLVPIVLMSIAFTLLYFTVPNRYVPLWHALIGGIFAGLAFEFMKRIFTFYIASFPTYTLVYGAFAIIPIFLLWLYFSWLVILIGAVIAATLSHWRVVTWEKSRRAGWQFEAALRVLQELAVAQASGHSVTLPWLRKRVDLGLDEIEEILDRLATANIARRSERNGWLLSRAPKDISTADVYRLFVFDVGTPTTTQSTYQAILSKLDAEQNTTLAPTLADLATPPSEAELTQPLPN